MNRNNIAYRLNTKNTFIFALIAMVNLFAGCNNYDENKFNSNEMKMTKDAIRLGHVELSFYAINGEIIKQLLERKGYKVERITGTHPQIYEQLGKGKIDLLAGTWMPNAHQPLFEKHGKDAVRLANFYEGAQLFWAVPEYIPKETVASIADLQKPEVVEKMKKAITVVGPGSGLEIGSQKIFDHYQLQKNGYNLATIPYDEWAAVLSNAANEKEWVTLGLWQPQYLNKQYPVRILEDPQQYFGGSDACYLVARKAFLKNIPEKVQTLLSNIRLSVAIVTEMDYAINVEKLSPEQVVKDWLKENKLIVEKWELPNTNTEQNIIDKLQGTWKITEAKKGGQSIKSEAYLEFTGNSFKRITATEEWRRDFTIKVENKQILLDIYPLTDPYKGKVLPGILKIENDQLFICHNAHGEERPQQFQSKSGTAQVLSTSKKTDSHLFLKNNISMNHEAKKVVDAMQQHAEANSEAFAKMNQAEQIQAARQGYEAIIPMAGEAEKIWNIENLTIKGIDKNIIPLRIYQPSANKNLPILLYIHGGGFVSGSLETHDRPLRKLVNQSGFIVVALDYRLAPEHPYPAGLNDCFSALQWIENNAQQINGNAQKIFIGGDSAGGNLATTTALKNRKEGTTDIAAQVLIYPNTDLNLDSDSWSNLGEEGYVLTKSEMLANVNHYLKDDAHLMHEYVSPLYAEDISDLPKTLIITGGYDPLHHEGEAYAKKLEQSKVPVTHWHYEGQIHGFFQLGGMIAEGEELITRISTFLKENS